jgi:hypothetical protein
LCMCFQCRVSDPDPDPHGSALIWVAGSESGSAFKLRIRIRIYLDDYENLLCRARHERGYQSPESGTAGLLVAVLGMNLGEGVSNENYRY